MEYLEIVSDGNCKNYVVTSSKGLSYEEKYLLSNIFSGNLFYGVISSYKNNSIFGNKEVTHLSIECDSHDELFREIKFRHDRVNKKY